MIDRQLDTRRGPVPLPAYVPVTTFGTTYPLDALVRPYLARLASAAMVSFHYARQLDEEPGLPLFVDSGGFASLFADATVRSTRGLGVIEVRREDETERIHPAQVLELQERVADVAFTLDFPIPPGMPTREARRRQRLTIANALWAVENRRRKDLLLFGCVQGWDVASYRDCAASHAQSGFDGIAIGGLVPRARDGELVRAVVQAVREAVGDLPLHVFGLGKPDLVAEVFAAGADSVDSSSYVKMAADGRLWARPEHRLSDPTPTDRLHLALCNLAAATGRSLPLSVTRVVFATHALVAAAANAPQATRSATS